MQSLTPLWKKRQSLSCSERFWSEPESPEELDELFDQTAERQYTRELLFSELVYLLLLVVCSVHPSVSAAYKVLAARLGVTKKSVYNKRWRYGAAHWPDLGALQC